MRSMMGGRLSGRVNGGRNTRARRRVLLDMVSVWAVFAWKHQKHCSQWASSYEPLALS
jgi:hypothetical protein